MKCFLSAMIFSIVLLFSCTDRDDNLEGIQIRVQNSTSETYPEVVLDSLVFSDLQPDDVSFYQKFDGTILPNELQLIGDSLSMTISVENSFEIDSINLNLFTYRIKRTDTLLMPVAELLKD